MDRKKVEIVTRELFALCQHVKPNSLHVFKCNCALPRRHAIFPVADRIYKSSLAVFGKFAQVIAHRTRVDHVFPMTGLTIVVVKILALLRGEVGLSKP